MLCEVLSEFPKYLLPLPCNVCVSVQSEHRQGDGINVRHNYPIAYYSRHITLKKWIKMMKVIQKHRFYVRLCYVKG